MAWRCHLRYVQGDGRKTLATGGVLCISDKLHVSMQNGALAPAPRIHALPIELLKQDPTAHAYAALVNPETGVAVGGPTTGQDSGTPFTQQQTSSSEKDKWLTPECLRIHRQVLAVLPGRAVLPQVV